VTGRGRWILQIARRRGRERRDAVGLPVPAPLAVEHPRAGERDSIALLRRRRRRAELDADRERTVALGVIDEPRVLRRHEAGIHGRGRNARIRDRLRRGCRYHDRRTERAVHDAVLAAAREVLGAIDDRLPGRHRAQIGDHLAGIRRLGLAHRLVARLRVDRRQRALDRACILAHVRR